jgi:outer membrane immunogenic protein
MNKHLLSVATAASLAAGPLMAADMPVKAPIKSPPPVIAPFNWTSCYIGGHVGGGWGDKEWFDNGVSFALHDVSGWLAGGQIGCDIQTGAVVFGIEGQAAWADISGGAPNILSSAFTSNSRIDSMGTVTGRIGYTWDRMLFYVKGGGAWVYDTHWQIAVASGTEIERGNKTRQGWTVGGGLEWSMASNWSARIEYSFMDFGTRRVSLAGLDSSETGIKQRLHSVKAGVNYRFDWGRPGVATY